MKITTLAFLTSSALLCIVTSVSQAAPPVAPGGPGGRPGMGFGAGGQPPTLPPITSVTVDSHGQFIVNSKPFFPIMIYGGPTDTVGLAKLHDAGFNVVDVSKPEEVVTLPPHGMYAALHVSDKAANASGVLLGMGVDSPAENFKTDMMGQTKAANAKVSAKLPGRPLLSAIGYWADEPAGVKANTILPKEKYDAVVEAVDVAGPYLYPVPYQPISSVGDAVARAKAAGGEGKPVLPILQLFIWDAKDRYPTEAELRCMVFESLIEGASGIGYYCYTPVTGENGKTIAAVQPKLWGSVRMINIDLARAAALLANSTPIKVELAEKDPAVRVRAAKTTDGATVVILANTSDKPTTITLKGVDQLTTRDSSVTVTATGSDTTVKLGAFGTAVLAPTMARRM